MYSSLVLKTTATCNLSCRYCYWRGRQPSSQPSWLSLELAQMVIGKFLQVAARQGQRMVNIVYHGGEPLLRCQDFYRSLLDFQARIKPQELRVDHIIQTNGTLLTSEWASFLRDFRFQVSVSLDGPSLVHDANRIGSDGRGSFSDVNRGLEALKRAGVAFSLNCVLSEASIPHTDAIFRLFQDLEPNSVSLDFLWTRSGAQQINMDGLGQHLIRLFDLWFEREPCTWDITLFRGIINLLLGGSEAICSLKPRCVAHLACDPLGNLYPCDYYVGDRRWTFGNIREVSLEDLEHNPVYIDFHCKAQPAHKCRTCSYFHVCGGGCSNQRYVIFGTFLALDPYCKVRKTLIDYIAHRLSERLKYIREINWVTS